MAGEIPVEQGDAARKQPGLLGHEGLQQGLLSVAGCPEDGAADRAAGAGGQRDDPQLRERGGPVPGPGRAEVSPVLLRVGQVHQHPVGSVRGHPGHHDRGRLVVADQGTGGVPEDLLHDLRRDQRPPLSDALSRGDVPVQGERDIREEPGQDPRRLGIGGAGQQGHRDDQPDHHRVGQQPAAFPQREPPVPQSFGDDLLDHAVAEARFQGAEADHLGQPRVRQHRAVPLDERGRGQDRPGEHRLLARPRRRPGHGHRQGTVNPQVNGRYRQCSRRSPHGRELPGTNCGISGQQTKLHLGLLGERGTRHSTVTGSPP